MKLNTENSGIISGSIISNFSIDDIDNDHTYTGIETPMKDDAFLISDIEKKEKISYLFKQIMLVMGLDLTDDSLKDTPKRVAKMYIDEIFSGLNPINKPKRVAIPLPPLNPV